MNFKKLVSIIYTTALLTTVGAISFSDSAKALVPTMWGVDEDDGQLFSIGDYTDVNNTFTDFGKLKWNDNGTIKNIGADIEAFTLDKDGTAYLALDRGIGNYAGQTVNTLLSFNIQDAAFDNTVVDILGVIGAGTGNNKINYDSSRDNISGLSINSQTGELVALLKNYDSDDENIVDEIYTINKNDGSFVSKIGKVEGLGERSRSGEDIEFDAQGNLYVTDNGDDELYQVDPLTGAIIAIVDKNVEEGFKKRNGKDASEVKIEALGWDFANNKLIANDDDHNGYGEISLEHGRNTYFGRISGLTDVEGIDFVPTADGNPVSKEIPEPTTIFGLIAVGAFGAKSLNKRKKK